MGEIMSKEDLDLSKYRNSELLSMSDSSTKHNILVDYLREKKQRNTYNSAIATSSSICLGIASLPSIGGLCYSLDATNVASEKFLPLFAVLAGAAVTSSIVSGIIGHHFDKKSKDYRFLEDCALEGKKDHDTLDKARNVVRSNGSYEDVQDIIMPKTHHYFTTNQLIIDDTDSTMEMTK